MDNDANTDVNLTEGETVSESSTENQPSETVESAVEEQKSEPTVPYSRFKEKVDEVNRLKADRSAKTLTNEESEQASPERADQDQSGAVDFGKLKKQLQDEGFVTRRDQERENRISEAKQLIKEFDGKNGLPAFDIEEVTAFMKDKRIYGSYRDAYNLMHQEEILSKRIEEAKKVGTGVTKPKGGDTAFSNAPSGDGELTRSQIAKMSPEEWAKAGGAKGLRDKIFSGAVRK